MLKDTIRDTTRYHLTKNNGVILGQCLTAVGWVGGTVPEMTEEEGIIELSMADIAGAGIAVGVALMGKRPIYVIRYQGFMWYNASPLLNYAAKSKEVWGIPCPILIRAIAMEGGIGPGSTGCHHSMVMRMPGMPVIAPMTSNEWKLGYDWFMEHDDPVYFSEHRKGFSVDYEMKNIVHDNADITLFPISAARLTAIEASALLETQGIQCNIIHLVWLKPFTVTEEMIYSLNKTGMGLVIDSDFEIAGASRSIAYDLMHRTDIPVHAVGLEDRSAGFAPHLDNTTPDKEKIMKKIKKILTEKA